MTSMVAPTVSRWPCVKHLFIVSPELQALPKGNTSEPQSHFEHQSTDQQSAISLPNYTSAVGVANRVFIAQVKYFFRNAHFPPRQSPRQSTYYTRTPSQQRPDLEH